MSKKYRNISVSLQTKELIDAQCRARFKKATKFPDALNITYDMILEDMAKFYLGYIK